jgi:disulfide bond formation protein DsbB
MLAEAPPACDQVSFAFMGLTLAGWNFVVSLLLAAFTLAAALGLARRDQRDRLAPAGR